MIDEILNIIEYVAIGGIVLTLIICEGSRWYWKKKEKKNREVSEHTLD